MAFARIGDIVLHYTVLGRADAPVLVFSNSLGSDQRIWQEVIPSFLDRYRVILYDKRGHGLSDAPDGPYSIDDHADDLIGLLDLLRIAQAAIVGLSVGGMIAQRLAVRAPARVRALVLCDTAAKIGNLDMWNQRIAAIKADGIASIADAILERWFTPAFRETRVAEYRGWRNMLIRTPTPGYVGTCATVRDADLTADAARISAPTLCLVGDQDGSTPPDLVRETANRIPDARFKVVASAGHLPCIEQPAVLSVMIDTHLREVGHG